MGRKSGFFLALCIFLAACSAVRTPPMLVRETIPLSSSLGDDAAGKLLLHSSDDEWFALDVRSGSIFPFDLLEVSVQEVAVSPNGGWIAYLSRIPVEGYTLTTVDGQASIFVRDDRYELVREESTNRLYVCEILHPLASLQPACYPYAAPLPENVPSRSVTILPARKAESWLASAAIQNVPALSIQSANGSQSLSFLDPEAEWNRLGGWLDDQTLVLFHYAASDVFNSHILSPNTYDQAILLNPFTGEMRISGQSYPEMMLASDPFPIAYAPSQEYLAYRAGLPGSSRIAIWSISDSRLAATMSGMDGAPLLWSEDSSALLSVSNAPLPEWFSVDTNGHIERLTELSNWFPNYRIFSPPSSQILRTSFLPFWIVTDSSSRFLLLDISTRRTYDYNLETSTNVVLTGTGNFFWLGDRYLAFLLGEGKLILLDLQVSEMFEMDIPENFLIAGWISDDTR